MRLVTLKQLLNPDGSRGTSLLVSDVCLRADEFRPIPSEEDERLICSIVRGGETAEAIAGWREPLALIGSCSERGSCQLAEYLISASIGMGEP